MSVFHTLTFMLLILIEIKSKTTIMHVFFSVVSNMGNFLEIWEFVANHDENIRCNSCCNGHINLVTGEKSLYTLMNNNILT